MAQVLISRNQELINYYLSSHSLRETSKKFGISYQRVHEILCENKIPRHKKHYRVNYLTNQKKEANS